MKPFALILVALFCLVSFASPMTVATAAGTCPPVGLNDDCGTLITLNASGPATIAGTGRGPYDGVDDTLVGVINNTNIPITSLGISSGLDVFGFDGDGICVSPNPISHLPGLDPAECAKNTHPLQSFGYGGANAYFDGISADSTHGTVHFITPIPPGGSSYFSLENAINGAYSCKQVVDNAIVATTPDIADILGVFTPHLPTSPPTSISLAQAATFCGFQVFDWQQTITSWPAPSNLATVESPSTPLVAPPNFLDPASLGGYQTPAGVANTTAGRFPLYYNKDALSTFCAEVSKADTSVCVLHPIEPPAATANALNFFDAPRDPCLPGGSAAPSCVVTDPTAHMAFTTHVVGVLEGFNPAANTNCATASPRTCVDLGIGFSWTSNFNGSCTPGPGCTVGDVTSLPSSSIPVVPTSGSGGATITAVQQTTNFQSGGVTVTTVNDKTLTSLTYTGATTQDFGDPAIVSANLTDANANTPLGGKSVKFTLGSDAAAPTCSGTTDATTGTASCTLIPNETPGPYTLSVTFAGDSTYQASSTTAQFTVTREETALQITSSPTLANGNVVIKARLTDDGQPPTLISGRTVKLTVGASSTNVTTDLTGVASATFTLTPGQYTVAAHFDGDSFYVPADAQSQTLFVYQPTQFVIWGGNAGGVSVGQDLTFWGSQWAKQVTGGAYQATANFKGYASQVTGTTWVTLPGVSSNPPSSVATYIGVLVATNVSVQGNTISGNVAHIVVLRVDNPANYQPDPQYTATGVVVAIIQ